MSVHEALVVKIEEILPHPGADRLEVVNIGGYSTCVRIGDFKVGDLAVFIEPDTVVDTTFDVFSFLADKSKNNKYRIKAMRLRGEQSFGLLIHAPNGVEAGEDCWELLGLEHYEPALTGEHIGLGKQIGAPAPDIPHVKYDMDNLKKRMTMFEDGEWVEITEKIHGANARYVYHDGQLHVSSHNVWKREEESNMWWQVACKYNLQAVLSKNPDIVLYGEVYGWVQNLKYGAKEGERFFAVFDIMENGAWWPTNKVNEWCDCVELPHVPVLYVGPWSEALMGLADGKTTINGACHIREGIVIKPQIPRNHPRWGRVVAKVVSVDYLALK